MTRRKFFSTLAISGLLLLPVSGHGSNYFRTGNQLAEECKGMGATEILCMGYIIGVHDMITVLSEKNVPYCTPPTITIGQIEKIVFTYFDKNPDKLHLPASWLIYRALTKAFPCRQ